MYKHWNGCDKRGIDRREQSESKHSREQIYIASLRENDEINKVVCEGCCSHKNQKLIICEIDIDFVFMVKISSQKTGDRFGESRETEKLSANQIDNQADGKSVHRRRNLSLRDGNVHDPDQHYIRNDIRNGGKTDNRGLQRNEYKSIEE